MTYLYVAVGGAAGAMARFAIGGWVSRWAGPGFPWATFAINVGGSLLLGILLRVLPGPDAAPAARALLTVGFCGAFTTFSTFGYETATLLQSHSYGTAAGYAVASVALSVLGVFGGLWIGTHLA
ncbi:MAG: fluoride efflux transporter CrcB [Gemmatimonadota bacterium]|nr:fluoride efflux transporter CrcB [Gemmatimonadota bacterium]